MDELHLDATFVFKWEREILVRNSLFCHSWQVCPSHMEQMGVEGHHIHSLPCTVVSGDM